MDKKEACHKLAEINEVIYDLEIDLERIESKIRLDDGDNLERLLSCKEDVLSRLEKAKEEHDDFYNTYSNIILS